MRLTKWADLLGDGPWTDRGRSRYQAVAVSGPEEVAEKLAASIRLSSWQPERNWRLEWILGGQRRSATNGERESPGTPVQASRPCRGDRSVQQGVAHADHEQASEDEDWSFDDARQGFKLLPRGDDLRALCLGIEQQSLMAAPRTAKQPEGQEGSHNERKPAGNAGGQRAGQ